MGITPFEPIKVWILCEDPREELMRRIMAAAVHFGLKPEDLKGRLFVDSFRDKDVIIAEKTPSGAKINRPVVGAFVQEVHKNGIGHSFVDPFVLTHRVPENDNGAIAEAANGWNQVADQGDCGVGLVQHTRKTNGSEVEVDDMRGGSSLLGVVRSVRVLNHMSHSEVKAACVSLEDRRRYIKIGEGAANMLPPSEKATWFRLESVDLNNASYRRPSDKVGVATPWTWPVTVATEIPIEAIRAVQEKVNAGLNRSSPQANDWVGFAVAEVLRLGDPSDKNNWPTIKDHIAKLVENGWLTPRTFFDAKKNVRPGYEVKNWASAAVPTSPLVVGMK